MLFTGSPGNGKGKEGTGALTSVAGVECVWAALFDSAGVQAGHSAAELLRSSVLKHIAACEGDLHRYMATDTFVCPQLLRP